MAMAFGRNGILYAVGDCNPAPPPSFECTLDSDFNSLYKVNVTTGAFNQAGVVMGAAYRDQLTGAAGEADAVRRVHGAAE